MKKYVSPKIEAVALLTADIITFSLVSNSGGDSYNWADYAKKTTASADMGDEFF